jgi:hypothetical protein
LTKYRERERCFVDLLLYIIMVGIIATTIGWCMDWVFSGTFDPIYISEPKEEEDHEYATMICRVCNHEVKYSVRKMKTDGEVKCDKCGSFLTEE